MRIAVVQTNPKLADVERNVAGITASIADTDADLIVFPECAVSGYGFASREAAATAAETVPGPSTERIVAACAAADRLAVIGLLECAGDDLFNTAVLVSGDGIIGHYRKMHLPYLGVDRFVTPGDLGFPVFQTPHGRIGLLICFDLSFPEAARCLKLEGAHVVVVPTNWPLAASTSCILAPPVRAQENHFWVVTADRVGEESGFRFRGESRICDPLGEVVVVAGTEEETIIADLEPLLADEDHQVILPGEYEINRMGQRRPQHYGRLAEE